MLYSEDKVGADFELTTDGDLKLDGYGRLTYTQSEETIANALVRRISTSTFGYTRYVVVAESGYLLNSDYGSTSNQYIGEPYPNIAELETIAKEAAQKDIRVENVDAYFTDTATSYASASASLEVSYTVKDAYLSTFSDINKEYSLSLMF